MAKNLLAYFVMNSLQWQISKIVYLFEPLFFYFKQCFIILKTLPRDLRVLQKAYCAVTDAISFKKKDMSVVGAFYKQLEYKAKKPCYYFEDKVWTYQDVEDYSNKVANVFQRAGLVKGDAVALMMLNCPEYVCVWLGLAKLGVITALINTNLRLNVLAHCIAIGNVKAIIFSSHFSTAVLEARDMLHREDTALYQIGGSTVNRGIEDLSKLMTLSPQTPPQTRHKPGYEDQLMYIYTSGTTGKPKAALVPHSRYLLFVSATQHLLGLRPDDLLYAPLPLYHGSGGAIGVGPALVLGVPAVIRVKFSASKYFEDCVKYNCTVGQYIGEICRYLLASNPKPEDKKHNVRMMVGNGLQGSIWVQFKERFNIPCIRELYAATEGNIILVNMDEKIGAVGCIPQCLPSSLVPIAIIKVDKDTLKPIRNSRGLCVRCKPGETGMIVGAIKQHGLASKFHGYLNQDESQSKIIYDVFRKWDQAFVSGDLMTMDEEGYIYFKDRTGDTFRWKGENVSTSEVESVVRSIIGLRDCTVYGVQVGELEGRAGMLAVSDCDDPLDLPGLAEGLDQALPSYARPLFLRVAKELPLTGTFKLKKTELQREGFDPNTVTDKLYFRQSTTFIPLTPILYQNILSGAVKL